MKWMKSENFYTRNNIYTFRIFTTVAEVISASLENIPKCRYYHGKNLLLTRNFYYWI